MAENNTQRPPIFLFTDGASSGNPGPGGYGVVLKCAGKELEMSGGFSLTTNNRMELLAVIKGLEAIRWVNAEVHVYSDSSYVTGTVNNIKNVVNHLGNDFNQLGTDLHVFK